MMKFSEFDLVEGAALYVAVKLPDGCEAIFAVTEEDLAGDLGYIGRAIKAAWVRHNAQVDNS